ncbi:MAG: hypothetical protein ACOC1O_05265 [bacterium]
MKVKAGDTVFFRDDLEIGYYYGSVRWSESKSKLSGKKAIIKDSNKTGDLFRVKNDGYFDVFSTKMLKCKNPDKYFCIEYN